MRSVWQEENLPVFPSFQGDLKTDVLIIGGGISGLLCAYLLKQKGIPYVLVEKNKICGGTTGHTTAKLTEQHGLIYHKLQKQWGVEHARGYFEANRQALETYAELCRRMDCDYEEKDNYVYSTNRPQRLEAEMKALERLGCEAKFFESVPLPIKTVGAVCFPKQAQFHPLKFLSAISRDLAIYEDTCVRELRENCALTDGGRICAEHIVVATHFPFINTHGSYFLKLYQHRSYVLALKGGENVNGMYVDEDRRGLSFRNYNDYLLLGGGGHRTGKKGGGYEELRSFATEFYPRAEEEYAWAAQDCISLDEMPYIGQYSKHTHHLYVASGFNKWGMSGAMVAARLLCDRIRGNKNEFEKIFSPSRSIMRTQLWINGGESVRNLLSLSQKRCPHMGCALKWNSAEHTWDCPCHGSRFTKEGKILDNPANKELKKE